MNKLVPQNEQQEQIIQAVLGVLQNVPIQMKPKGSRFYDNVLNTGAFNFLTRFDWRVKPTGLRIPSSVWKLLSVKWRYIAVDKDKKAWVYTDKPEIERPTNDRWYPPTGEALALPLEINTYDVDWKDSLTERPQELP